MDALSRLLKNKLHAHLRDTLPPLSPAKDGPGDAAGVLALEEKRLGLAILEAEDLAVGADEELALVMLLARCPFPMCPTPSN